MIAREGKASTCLIVCATVCWVSRAVDGGGWGCGSFDVGHWWVGVGRSNTVWGVVLGFFGRLSRDLVGVGRVLGEVYSSGVVCQRFRTFAEG